VAHRRRKFRTQHGRRCSHSRGKANDLTEPTFIASLNGLSGFVLEVETAGVALTAMMSAFKRRHSAASAGHPFRLIAEALTGLRSRSCIIDGEAVACDDNGLASFERIRYRQHDGDVFLYAFDLIELNGDDLRRDPLQVRKATLASIVAKARPGDHRLGRVRPYLEGRGSLRAGSVPQRVGQARPGRAVRILAVHARPSETVISCVGKRHSCRAPTMVVLLGY
jgi:ATP dependent DNA ligase domain